MAKAPQKIGMTTHPAKPPNRLILYGRHAVAAALKNPDRQIFTVKVSRNALQHISGLLSARGLTPDILSTQALNRLLPAGTVHQGIVIETAPLPPPDPDRLWQCRRIVALDQVTDPQNVGAILRSAAIFGADALVMPRRGSPPLAGALAKAASGALEKVPVFLVPNLARSLAEMADHGIRRLGLAGEAETPLEAQAFDMPLALVLGAEGKGLRRLVRSHCDQLVHITTADPGFSLNVSTAAAIALHVVFHGSTLSGSKN